MSKQSSSPAKAVGILAGVIGGVCGYLLVSHMMHNGFSHITVEKKIEKMVVELNKQLPMQVDEVTRWDRAEAGPGKSYSNIYTLSLDQLSKEQEQMLKEGVTHKLLALPETKAVLDQGVTIWFKYYDASGKLLLEFPVSQ